MALLDIFRRDKGKEEVLKRPPKGALKRAKKPAVEEIRAGAVSARTGDKTPEGKKKPAGAKEGTSELASLFISSPHITERSVGLTEVGVYSFRVRPAANKILIKQAIKELYGFSPVKVRVLNMPGKTRITRGIKGTKSGYKKALVYLKQGDKIELS